jgi:hypothetical protein
MNSQMCYQLRKTWKPLKIWSSKGFSNVATILPGLKPGQDVLPSGLKTLSYHMGNMHNLASKIWEDTTLQTLLTVKQTIEILQSESWIVELCLYLWNKFLLSSRIFENLQTCRTDYMEHMIFWKCGLNQFLLILKNCWLSLMVQTVQNLDNFEFELRLWNSTSHMVS